MTSSAVNHRERFVKSNNNLRVSKKLATAACGHRHHHHNGPQVDIVVISSLNSSASSSGHRRKVEGCNGGASVNLPPITKTSVGSTGGCNNRIPTQQHLVQTYSTRYRSKSTSNDLRLPYSSPTNFGDQKQQNKSNKAVTPVGSMTSSSSDNKLHMTSPNSFSSSWPNTRGKSKTPTTLSSSTTSGGKTSGLPSCKDESDVIKPKQQPTATRTTKSGKISSTTTATKKRIKRRTATGKKTMTTKNNNNTGNKSPEVTVVEQPEVVVTAPSHDVTVSDDSYYDDLEDRCRRWIADVARERLEHPDKIFLPHLLLP